MNSKISSIGDLKNIESFLQINFIKGYKYVDRAGEIVNKFHKSNLPPAFQMNLEGLIIENPEDLVKSVKISSNVFWAHFNEPNSFEWIENYFTKNSNIITNLLDVTEVSRIGWRNHFIKDFAKIADRDAVFNKFSLSSLVVSEEMVFSAKLESINALITIKKVVKEDKNAVPAILFDIDCFENNIDGIPTNKIAKKILDIKKTLRSDVLLKIINDILVVEV